MEKKIRRRCHNCKFRGVYFKLGKLTHCHCEHPDEKENMTPWDTLREFWSTCQKHEFNHTLNINFMSNSENFEKYVAAVSMAELASKGSGDLNQFDHVAKDLHEEGFDEMLENCEQWKRNCYRIRHFEEIGRIAENHYKE